ncbi:MAG: hypothetical protein AABX70_06540, partial [Nanoarchaeota archaeon]
NKCWNAIITALLLYSAKFSRECDNYDISVKCLSKLICVLAESENFMLQLRKKYSSTIINSININFHNIYKETPLTALYAPQAHPTRPFRTNDLLA